MALALYRKYRSRKLADIVGQEHVTDILARALESDHVAHAYLFTGPRGTGKTSIARIMAHEINGLEYTDDSIHLDIIEIDAASNNGVDDIRDLRDKVQLTPVSAKKKIYIIDEVHMLSKPAFNALLKTLEEPPEHVVFILATTDIDKLPDTIISRTQRHTFRRATKADLMKNLDRIVKKESIKISKPALELVATHSDGSYRDSVSLLDQLRSVSKESEPITPEIIEASLGLAPQDAVTSLVQAAKTHSFNEVIATLSQLEAGGVQATVIAEQLIQKLREEIVTQSDLLPLLDALLSVSQSALPAAKLQTVLGLFAAPEPTTKALNVAVARTIVQTDDIPALVTKASQAHPKDDIVPKLTPAHTKQKRTTPNTHLDWSQIVAKTKEASMGLYTVLQKCTATHEGTDLIIYARNEFYKKKLEHAKYMQIMSDILQTVTRQDWTITVIPSTKPSENSHVASVTAIMGGGEEVSIESAL